MTLNYVTLICDEGAGQGYFRPGGTATLAPSAVLTDATDHLIVDQSPITVTFSTSGPPSVRLLACDDANLLPGPGNWTWVFTPPAGSGMTTFTFFLNFAGGATQYLSAQVPVSAPASFAAAAAPGAYVAPSGDTTGATDTALIQALENLGAKKIYFAAGNFWTTGLTKAAKTYWDGAGIGATILNLAAGANADVIQSAGFAALTLTGAGTWGVSGIYDFGISNMTIDGNRSNQTGTSYGVRIFGYQWTLTNLTARNCFTDGLWTEWGPLATTAPVTSNGSESTAINVRSFWNGRHGWSHLGPSDCRKTNVLCYENNQAAGASGIGYWALKDQTSNICLTAVAMNGTNASGFTGTFQVQAAALGGATDLYAAAGTLFVTTSSGTATMTYTGKTAAAFTGCTVTAGAGTFVTGNAVTTTVARFTTNGLQLAACHSWSNNHTWAAVFDGQVSEVDCHWEGGQYGQMLIRNSANKAGGFIYDFTGIASGCGIQLGDNGLTGGVPQSAAITANACDLRTRVSAFLNDIPARASLNWVSCTQSSADLMAVTKTTGTYATTVAAGSNGTDISTWTGGSPGTLQVASTQSIPNGAGSLTVATANGNQTVTFTGTNGSNGGSQGGAGRTAGTQFTGCVSAAPASSTLSTGGAVSLNNIGSAGVGGTPDTGSRVRVQTASSATALSTGGSLVQELGPRTYDVGSAATAFRLRNNGSDRMNVNTANGQVQWPNGTDHRWYSDNYTTKTAEISGATGAVSGATFAPAGITGATSVSRWAGAIASGTAPASGTFTTGDVLVVLTGGLIICTAGGTSGTWASLVPAPVYAAPASFTPGNPAGTVSTSLVMMGIGSACQYTPASSGVVLATICGVYDVTGTAENGSLAPMYGLVSNGVPANAAVPPGGSVRWGTGSTVPSIRMASAAAGWPFSFTQLLSLTPGAAYWFDLEVSTSNAAGTATCTNIVATLAELP